MLVPKQNVHEAHRQEDLPTSNTEEWVFEGILNRPTKCRIFGNIRRE